MDYILVAAAAASLFFAFAVALTFIALLFSGNGIDGWNIAYRSVIVGIAVGLGLWLLKLSGV